MHLLSVIEKSLWGGEGGPGPQSRKLAKLVRSNPCSGANVQGRMQRAPQAPREKHSLSPKMGDFTQSSAQPWN